jgi:hypothetical protein
MDLLQSSGFSNRHRDFEAVLQDENQPIEARCLAATNLGKIATDTAMKILVQNSNVYNERVLASVMSALGRIGDESTLDLIIEVKKRGQGLAAAQAEFAAKLIVHRLGLTERNYTEAKGEYPLGLDLPCARPFRVSRPDDADAERCVWSLGSQPFGIELDEHSMYQARCGKNTWMVALNRDFSDAAGFEALTARKGILGVVALRGERTNSYSVTYLVLTSPDNQRQEMDVLLYRPHGELCFRGTARVTRHVAQFSLFALPQPGAVAVKIAGTLENGELKIGTSLSTPFVQVKKREPIEQVRQPST